MATWRTASATFEHILRKHGIPQPTAITDVDVAWLAFVDFSQTGFDGIAPADEDGDGFIIQWGRRSWGDERLMLTLTRQFAVVDNGRDQNDPYFQPELWQLELNIAFNDQPALTAHLTGDDASNTDFQFDPIGPQRAAAMADARARAHQNALVRAMWSATPANSELTFGCEC